MKDIFLCSISNISVGDCNQDCLFCTQSKQNGIDIEKFIIKDEELIFQEAILAKKSKALGFCFVSSGKSLDYKKLELVCRVSKRIKKEIDNIHLIACLGIAKKGELLELKKAGIDSYNHNLETSQSFYKKICTTMNWEDRFNTALLVKESGLLLCCGGIFGIGEEESDRKSLMDSLSILNPHTIPLNFYHQHKTLKIQDSKLTLDFATSLIKDFKLKFSNSIIMIAGGREILFNGFEKDMFEAGADGIILGDYLTTKGNEKNKDLQMLENLGYKVSTFCKGNKC